MTLASRICKERVAASVTSNTIFAKVALAVLLGTAITFANAPPPIIQFGFEENNGYSTTNTGSLGGHPVVSHNSPHWSTNVEANGGVSMLDFGSTSDTSYHVDLTGTYGLQGLKSFTITGWLNCKSAATAYGGNRIISWYNNVSLGQGVDLAMHADGSLGMGVNQWNDQTGGTSDYSSIGKIPVDPDGGFNNWIFFAVTYNSTVSSGQISYYFGGNGTSPKLDVNNTYNAGPVGTNVSPTLTVGNHNPSNRINSYALNQSWKGGMDQIQVFGSTTDGTGALSFEDIVVVQNATQFSGTGGVLYQQYANIPGSTVGNLISAPNFPDNPTSTTIFPSFDGPKDDGASNYGAKMSGWVLAPQSGPYTFWIAADDNAELRLSTDANPVNKNLIASVSNYTGYQAWTTNTSQQSAPINLVAGQYYCIEALMKQATGGDNLSVGWQLPSGLKERPIPAGRVFLLPIPTTLFPTAINLYDSGTSNTARLIDIVT